MPNMKAAWRIPPAPIPEELITEVLEADVVVVGVAHAGTAAARAAAEEGAKVIAIDKQREKVYHAVGNDLGHINSKFLASRGVPRVDEIEFLNDWQMRSNNRSNPKLVMQFARTAGECFDWMIEPLTQEQKDAIVVTHWPGNKNFTGDISGFKFWPGCAEFPGIASLSKTAKLNHEIAKQHGAQFLWETTGEQLVKTGDRVTGVIAKNKEGNYIQINAKKGVIIAAGDFSKNKEMVEDLCDEITTLKDEGQEIVATMRGQDGSGIRMGVWAGGRMSPAPIATMGANYFFPNQVIGTAATLWLDRDGNRYCNEGFGDAVLSGVEGARLPKGYVTSVFDDDLEDLLTYQAPGHNAIWASNEEEMSGIRARMNMAREAGAEGCSLDGRPIHTPPTGRAKGAPDIPDMPMFGGMPPIGPGGPGGMPGGPGEIPGGPGGMPFGPGGPGGPDGGMSPMGPGGRKADPKERMFCADTLEELADMLGFEGKKKENFLNSIARYNSFCETGRDEDFGKDPRILRPVVKAPFYAFRRYVHIGNEFLATVDGLWTDDRQNVVDQNKEPIPGLYATGNSCGRRWGVQYSTPIPGVSIGMAWTLGRLCGINAAHDGE